MKSDKLDIERLIVFPTHVKTEGGYEYPKKYVGKVFRFEDKIIHFRESSYMDYPAEIFENYKDTIIQHTLELLEKQKLEVDASQERVNNSINDVKRQIEGLINNNEIEELKIKLEESQTQITKLRTYIDNIEVTTVDKFQSVFDKLEEFYKTTIAISNKTVDTAELEAVIDKKLSTVYSNFEQVSKKLVDDSVSEALKDSKRDHQGKLKISTLSMMKELGMETKEIIELAKEGLL